MVVCLCVRVRGCLIGLVCCVCGWLFVGLRAWLCVCGCVSVCGCVCIVGLSAVCVCLVVCGFVCLFV